MSFSFICSETYQYLLLCSLSPVIHFKWDALFSEICAQFSNMLRKKSLCTKVWKLITLGIRDWLRTMGGHYSSDEERRRRKKKRRSRSRSSEDSDVSSRSNADKKLKRKRRSRSKSRYAICQLISHSINLNKVSQWEKNRGLRFRARFEILK